MPLLLFLLLSKNIIACHLTDPTCPWPWLASLGMMMTAVCLHGMLYLHSGGGNVPSSQKCWKYCNSCSCSQIVSELDLYLNVNPNFVAYILDYREAGLRRHLRGSLPPYSLLQSLWGSTEFRCFHELKHHHASCERNWLQSLCLPSRK
jgi:hypothetical protein